jgi:thymidylate kinase
MLVSFVGSPCSGKTTTSAMLFAKLKAGGVPVENVQEYARLYIAKKRLAYRAKGEVFTSEHLQDDDQWNIMRTQAEWELSLDVSLEDLPGSLVVSDSSALNSLLYMSAGKREAHEVKFLAKKLRARTALIFYCRPVDVSSAAVKEKDPNRVHSRAQAEDLDTQWPDLLKAWGLGSYVLLEGSPEARLARAYQNVNTRLSMMVTQAVKAEQASPSPTSPPQV